MYQKNCHCFVQVSWGIYMLYIRCIEAGIFQGAALVEENILLGVHISSQKLCPIYTP